MKRSAKSPAVGEYDTLSHSMSREPEDRRPVTSNPNLLLKGKPDVSFNSRSQRFLDMTDIDDMYRGPGYYEPDS